MLFSGGDWAGQRWLLVKSCPSCACSGRWSWGCPGWDQQALPTSPHLRDIILCKKHQHPLPSPGWVFQKGSETFTWFPQKEAARSTQEHLWNMASGKSWRQTHTGSWAVLTITSLKFVFYIWKVCRVPGRGLEWHREGALNLLAVHWCRITVSITSITGTWGLDLCAHSTISPCLRPLQSTRVQVLFTSTLSAQHYLVHKRDSMKL